MTPGPPYRVAAVASPIKDSTSPPALVRMRLGGAVSCRCQASGPRKALAAAASKRIRRSSAQAIMVEAMSPTASIAPLAVTDAPIWLQPLSRDTRPPSKRNASGAPGLSVSAVIGWPLASRA